MMYRLAVVCLSLYTVSSVPIAPEPTAPHYVSCAFKHNGLLEIGCWGTVNCKDGIPHTMMCPTGEVYDRMDEKCVAPHQMNPATKYQYLKCDETRDCTGKRDERHADLEDGCQSYYLCEDGVFAGRFFCPGNLVFNDKLQVCDWIGDTAPSCGSLNYTRTTYAPGPI